MLNFQQFQFFCKIFCYRSKQGFVEPKFCGVEVSATLAFVTLKTQYLIHSLPLRT